MSPEMQRALQQQSYFVQEDVPNGLLEEMLEHFLDTTDFENFEDFKKNRSNTGRITNWDSCKPLDWFLGYLEENLGDRYFIVQIGFPFLRGSKTGTGVHFDRTQSIFDSSGEGIVQCWIPIWEQNMPDSGLRLYPRFVDGEQVYDDDTYGAYHRTRMIKGRLGAKRFDIPVEADIPEPVDFGVRDNLGKIIWFNSNCLHGTLKKDNADFDEDQSRIALAIRFVRKGCSLRPGFTLQDLRNITTENDPYRLEIEQRYF